MKMMVMMMFQKNIKINYNIKLMKKIMKEKKKIFSINNKNNIKVRKTNIIIIVKKKVMNKKIKMKLNH